MISALKIAWSVLVILGKAGLILGEAIVCIVLLLCGPAGWLILYFLCRETKDEKDERMTRAFQAALQRDRNQQAAVDEMVKRMKTT